MAVHTGSQNSYIGINEFAFEGTTAVPEPGSLTLLAGGAGLGLMRRRRKH